MQAPQPLQLSGVQINPYFMDISGLSWTTEGYKQHQRFCSFVATKCSVFSVYMWIIVMHVIVGSQSVIECYNEILAVSQQKYVE